MNALDSTSTRPYLVRALYDWCTDNGLTPYVAVAVDDTVQVPREYVKNNEIVLNISFDATSSLKLGNDFIEFKARFAGSASDIMVPIGRVIAIYARENGQGMAFPLSSTPPAGGALAVIPEAATPTPAVAPAASPALVQAPHAPDSKIVQLVPADGNAPPVDGGDSEPPEPPKPKQGTRPSLKRVK
ncbi:MAG: Stringent starvation protein [Polaromonas sp.]|nr:Stringent starvation protein [Polaromonas sp.]